eukprot:scaffold574_cov333-Pavlova_lutheri.AAC.20
MRETLRGMVREGPSVRGGGRGEGEGQAIGRDPRAHVLRVLRVLRSGSGWRGCPCTRAQA